MTQALVHTRLSRTNHVESLFNYFENQYNIEPHVKETLRESPRVESLDRLMAFRVVPWYSEMRAALDRIERGCYGQCTVCKQSISDAKLRRSPTSRLCDSCVEKYGLEGFEV